MVSCLGVLYKPLNLIAVPKNKQQENECKEDNENSNVVENTNYNICPSIPPSSTQTG